jgi:hypothetical protein
MKTLTMRPYPDVRGFFSIAAIYFMISNVHLDGDELATDLHNVVSTARDRIAALQRVAELLKTTDRDEVLL